MRTTYSVAKDHNYGINQILRETLLLCPGSASRENSVQVLATTTNSGSERSKFLSSQSKIRVIDLSLLFERGTVFSPVSVIISSPLLLTVVSVSTTNS